ncbi:MAG: 1-phosphofructokinase family hexose kinase [Promethearchaeota archaeon]
MLLNPTLDEIFEIDDFIVGGTFETSRNSIFPAGKALSFAISARKFIRDEEIIILGFIGEKEKNIYTEYLDSFNIISKLISVRGNTRSNKTIVDAKNNTTTHIRQIGFEVSKTNLKTFYSAFSELLKPKDFVILSGSLPGEVPVNVYQSLIKQAKNIGAFSILDSSGEAMKRGLIAQPYIIKSNLVEIAEILENPGLRVLNFKDLMKDINIISKSGNRLLDENIKIILITLGEYGALMITKERVLYGNISIDNVLDTVGSGDAFLGGFIASYYR